MQALATTELVLLGINAHSGQTKLVLHKQRLFTEKKEDIVGPEYINFSENYLKTFTDKMKQPNWTHGTLFSFMKMASTRNLCLWFKKTDKVTDEDCNTSKCLIPKGLWGGG